MEKGRLQTTEKQPKTPNHIALAGGVLGAFAVVGTLGAQQVIAKPVDVAPSTFSRTLPAPVAPLKIAQALPKETETFSILNRYHVRPVKETTLPEEGQIIPNYTARPIGEYRNTGPNQFGTYELRSSNGRVIGEINLSTSRAGQGVMFHVYGSTIYQIDKMQIRIGNRTAYVSETQILRQANGHFRARLILNLEQHRYFVNGREEFRVQPITPIFNFPDLLDIYRKPSTVKFPTK